MMNEVGNREYFESTGEPGAVENCPDLTRQNSDEGRIRVLVLDDDPQVCRMVVRVLDAERFFVRCVSRQDLLYREVLKMAPDVILLDIHLSTYSSCEGITCLRSLRNSGYSGPVYMLSADSSVGLAQLAAKNGADGYLVEI